MGIGRVVTEGIDAVAGAISKYEVLEGAGNFLRKMNTDTSQIARSIATKDVVTLLNSTNQKIAKDITIDGVKFSAGDALRAKSLNGALQAIHEIGAASLDSSAIAGKTHDDIMAAGHDIVKQAFQDSISKAKKVANTNGVSSEGIKKTFSKIDARAERADRAIEGFRGFVGDSMYSTGADVAYEAMGIGDVIGSDKALDKAKAAISGYFTDPENGKTRIKALAGYGAGAIGLRYLSGGDLTHNNKGERDIAGIPFI